MNVKDIPIVSSVHSVPRNHPVFKLSLDELQVLEGALLVERGVLTDRLNLVTGLIAGERNRQLNAARRAATR
jgi:hypothetical protein